MFGVIQGENNSVPGVSEDKFNGRISKAAVKQIANIVFKRMEDNSVPPLPSLTA